MEKENTGKNRGGRPRKTGNRAINFSIRFTNPERFVLKEKAKLAGITLSNYIRQAALTGKIFSKISPKEQALLRSLSGIAGNLNQLTKASHKEGFTKNAFHFSNLLKGIEEVITKFKG